MHWYCHRRTWFEVASLFALMLAFSFGQSAIPPQISPDWVLHGAFGIPLTAGLILGRSGILLSAIAAALGGFLTRVEPLPVLVSVIGCSFEAAFAAFWLRRGPSISADLDHPRDIASLVFVAAFGSAFRAVAEGILAIGFQLPDPFLGIQVLLATGLMFNVIFCPAMLLWMRGSGYQKPTVKQCLEITAAFGLSLSITSFLYAGSNAQSTTLSMPLLAVLLVLGYWIAFRFYIRGMATIIPLNFCVILFGAVYRGNLAPVFPAGAPPLEQCIWLIATTAVAGLHLLIASSAQNYRLREEDREEWVRAARKQTERLKEVNERLALQSLELADQTTELARQRDQYETLARELSEKRAWLETVLAQLPVGILLIDSHTRTLTRNSRYEQTLGLGSRGQGSDLSDQLLWPFERLDGTKLPYEESPIVRAVREGVTTNRDELRLVRPGTGWAEVSVNAAPIRRNDGEILGAVLVVDDVSSLRNAERAARDNEDRLRFALRSARMLAWEWDPGTNAVRRSDSLEHWLGLSAAESSPDHDTFMDLIHADDRPRVTQLLKQLENGMITEFVIEYRLKHRDGNHVWVESRGQARLTSSGRAIKVIGVMTDISERKQSEERLRLLESAVVHANDSVIVLEANHTPSMGRRVLYVNDAFTRITGYSPEEVVGRSLHFLRGPRTDVKTLNRLRDALLARTAFACELLNYRKDGSEVWVDLSLVPVAGPDGQCQHFVMIQRDVTDRRRAEEAVRRSEERLRVLGDNVPNGAIFQFMQHADGTVQVPYMSAGIERMTHVPAAEIMSDPNILYRSLHPEEISSFLPKMQQSVLESTAFNHEFRYFTRDGELRWAHCQSMPSPKPDGGTLWNGVLLDITARKRVEAALRESEQLFRGMFETTSAGVSILGPDGTFTACNPAFAELLSRPSDQIIGHAPQEFTHPDDWASQSMLIVEVLTGKRDHYQIRKRYLRPDKSIIHTELSTSAIRGSQGELLYTIGVSVDVTSRQQLEEQLRQSQKMEALGQLAGGIAHDFNNLLTAVIGNLGLLRVPEDDPSRPLLRSIEQAATRAADLTRKLLGYARRNQLLISSVRPSEMIGEVVDILRRTFDPRIRIQIETRCDDVLTVDSTLINQAIFNLCLNARDAMPEGGTLTIDADSLLIREEEARPPSRAGNFLRIAVSDTGMGISEQVMARLFEPFFTTKEVGKGTGLGLPMVHGIMTQHGGWVNVETFPGRGSRFELYLPITRKPSVSLSRMMPDESPEEVPNTDDVDTVLAIDPGPDEFRPGTILLVDDESMIRCLARTILEQAGHTVIEAEDGADAVEIFSREKDQIDLIIMDLTMPRLSGRDAYRRIVQILPEARVLFSSGYSVDALSPSESACGLLSKPYRPADLLAAVRKAMTDPFPAGTS